ncbi:hypothetical protein QYG89_11055 [Bacillus sp. B190/17]|uniref:Uncharacterized protein n=1 Tax=Bacillus lumedeiriae TaxID=3058829 RepID=A0ABW8I9N1_9BACI
MSEPIVAALLLFLLIALGEFLSIISRARIPMLLVVFIGYFALIWTGIFPKEIVDHSKLGAFGSIIVAPVIVHMGTMIPFRVLKDQIKAVGISLAGVISATVLILLVAAPIIGYDAAVAGTGPLTGGLLSFLVTSQKLQELGLVSLLAIPVLIIGLQSVVGMPIAGNMLRRYAQKFIAATDVAAYAAKETNAGEEQQKGWLSERYQTQVILLLQLFIGGAIAIGLDKLTGVNYSIWALVIGFIGAYIGFYQNKMMERANSFGISMVGIIFLIIASMNSVTFEMFIDNLPKVLVILVVGAIGIMIGGYAASKLFKWDPLKGIPVALTAMFGFPGDFILCEEISRSVGKNEQERQAILDEILTPMLVGGFTTVTAASVIIASILIQTL